MKITYFLVKSVKGYWFIEYIKGNSGERLTLCGGNGTMTKEDCEAVFDHLTYII